MRKLSFHFLLASLAIISFKINAQTDSIILKNKNVIVGEIKGMDRGVVTIETDYSKDDFRIEWGGIEKIYTTATFIISLIDGTRFNGKLEHADSTNVKVKTIDGEHIIKYGAVVYLKPLDKGFLDRLHASIDFGFNLTKSQNLMKLNLRSNIGYLQENWSTDISYNSLLSSQDEVDDIKKTDGGLAFNYFLGKDWYIPLSLTFLTNTELQIDLRTLGKLGIGNYIIHTNQSYWGISGGVSYNSENYIEAPDRNSWEGFLGTELNLYDIGDLNLLTKLIAYPSITEAGRWRIDYNFDSKYDLPLDFYIMLGFTLNYDNRPVENSPSTDYVLSTGLGWKW